MISVPPNSIPLMWCAFLHSRTNGFWNPSQSNWVRLSYHCMVLLTAVCSGWLRTFLLAQGFYNPVLRASRKMSARWITWAYDNFVSSSSDKWENQTGVTRVIEWCRARIGVGLDPKLHFILWGHWLKQNKVLSPFSMLITCPLLT